MERHQYPLRPQFNSSHPPPSLSNHEDARSSKRMRIGSPPPPLSHQHHQQQQQQASDHRYHPSQSHHHQQHQHHHQSRYPDRASSISPPLGPGDHRGMTYRVSSQQQQQQQHLPPMSQPQHHPHREDPPPPLYRGPTSTPPLSDRPLPGMPREGHAQSAQYRASPPNAPPYHHQHHQSHHQQPQPQPQHHQHQQQQQQQHHQHHQHQHQQQHHQPPPPPHPSERNKQPSWYDDRDHRSQQHHYPPMHHQHQQEPPSHHSQYPPPHAQQSQHQYSSPYPPPPISSASHLQSTHNQLQRQLRQEDRTPPPSHLHQPPPPPPQQSHHHRSPSDHVEHHHHHHNRSSSYQENRYSTPPLLSASINRGMPPPSSSSPHPPAGSRGPPPFPPPSGPFQGGRDLPSITSLPIPRASSSMSLSNILGNDTPPARSRNEPPPPPPIQHRESLPPRPLQPDYSPLKRPYTPDYPASAPINDRSREVSDSRSPSGGAQSLPPLGKQSGMDTPPSSHRSGPSPGLQPSPMPPRPLSQPAATGPQPMQVDRIKEEPAQQSTSRLPHYRDEQQAPPPFEKQTPQQSPRRPAAPRETQRPVSPPETRQEPPATTASQQQASSPAYHHLPASAVTAPSVPLSAYTTTMPASPFAITPALPNSTTLPMPPQFESGVDKRRQNLSQSSIQFPADREMEKRERDVTPLRAEEALGQRVHERKAAAAAGQGSPMSGVIATGKLSSPRPERKVTEEYTAAATKREPEDSEVVGVNGFKGDAAGEKASAKKRKHHPPGHHHHHHSSHASHAPHHHHHHHHSKSDAAMGDDGLQGPLLPRNVASPAPPPAAPVNQITTLPPKVTINNSTLLEAISSFPSSHLGSASYTPLVLDPDTHAVQEQFMIPHFVERENCTFDVRIAARYLGIAERSKVCKKRMLWGSGVYTDDSNIIAVLVHEGHLPVVHNGTEVCDYADEHDSALAKIAQQQSTKKSGRAKKDQLAASLLADGGGIPQAVKPVQKDKDLQVKLRIAPPLTKYGSSVRYGLKSRAWEKHDGMSFIVEEVKWVHKGAADERGSLGKRKRIPTLETQRRECYSTKNGELTISDRPGATSWLALRKKEVNGTAGSMPTAAVNGIDTAGFPHKATEVMAAG